MCCAAKTLASTRPSYTAIHRETPTLHSAPPPLVEALLLGVALEAAVLDDEAHALVEAGGDGGRLLPQQDVDGAGHGVAQLRVLARRRLAALGVLAVHQPV